MSKEDKRAWRMWGIGLATGAIGALALYMGIRYRATLTWKKFHQQAFSKVEGQDLPTWARGDE